MSYPLLDRELKQAYDVLADTFLVPVAPNPDSGWPEGKIFAEFMLAIADQNAESYRVRMESASTPQARAHWERWYLHWSTTFKELSPWVPFFRALYDRFNPPVTQ